MERFGVRDEDLILYGQSVGSGPTLDLASRLSNLRAVVLHSPILSGMRALYRILPYQAIDRRNLKSGQLVHCYNYSYIFDGLGFMLYGRPSFCTKFSKVIKKVRKIIDWNRNCTDYPSMMSSSDTLFCLARKGYQ
ncbi:hypothetical protein QJS10_CPA02g00625 [Acorus calamus]|uniref:Uncharacterized protein n=1 Tax=Acorus calamus TaxID=4465 RepID=A0AAV9FAU7_ACOCL|nr:hypothetical protein QJS10_CPA02g00625 [Acorus calamus]